MEVKVVIHVEPDINQLLRGRYLVELDLTEGFLEVRCRHLPALLDLYLLAECAAGKAHVLAPDWLYQALRDHRIVDRRVWQRLQLHNPVPVEIHLPRHVDRVLDHAHRFARETEHQQDAGMDAIEFAEYFSRREERLHAPRLLDLPQNLRVAGFHADVHRDASASRHRRHDFMLAGSRDQPIGRIPGDVNLSHHHLVEQADCALVILQQIVVEPHDMPDAVLVLEDLKLVHHGFDRALAYSDSVQCPHAAERALRATATIRQNRGEPRPLRLEAVERADRAVVRDFVHRQEVVSRDHVNVASGRFAVPANAVADLSVNEDHLSQLISLTFAVD